MGEASESQDASREDAADSADGTKSRTTKKASSAPPKCESRSDWHRFVFMFQLRIVPKKNMGLMVPVKAHRA